jgi:hypothetical protein
MRPDANIAAMTDGFLLFVSSPNGYALHEYDGEVPVVGEEFEDEAGNVLVITKVGASPLPGDTRLCAYSVGKR